MALARFGRLLKAESKIYKTSTIVSFCSTTFTAPRRWFCDDTNQSGGIISSKSPIGNLWKVQKEIDRLLDQNRAWVKAKSDEDPEFFAVMKEVHAPQILWIGCSDARVPADQLLGERPGKVFVHRNISNMVPNAMHIEYLMHARNTLSARLINVFGHTFAGCGY